MTTPTKNNWKDIPWSALDETDVERVEEHLLTCEICRDRLQEADVYNAAMRGAARSLRLEAQLRARQPARSWFPLWSDVLAVGLALLAFTLAWGRWAIHKPAGGLPVAVLLETTRDSRTQTAPVSRPLLLTADLTQLASYPAYCLEVVDATGRRAIESAPAQGRGKLSLPIPGGLARGAY